ncbi:MAG: D-alanine--D-alanine ligase [Bacteroidota bacterium]|nr:D-alanine--D-alanine ligase [Bacteroidota bacterium]
MKKNIAIIAGGNSAESVISLKSAEQLSTQIDKDLYQTYIIYIKGTDWKAKGEDFEGVQVNKNDFSIEINGQKITFDCALMAIHGNPGEDGHLQGYFDMMELPYTSCDMLTSALTFDKYVCKNYLRQFGICTANAILVRKGQNQVNPEDVVKELHLPLFVKPNKNGSSVGVTKVKVAEQIIPAIEKAFVDDDEVIIEEFIEGTEITCGLIKAQNKKLIFPITEIVSKNEFFDYEAKYQNGFSQEITPARIDQKVEEDCKNIASEIYDVLNCKGIVRVDYIFSKDKLYFLEINTVPGMSESSIVPKQIRTAGMTMKEVLTLLIEDSISRK